MVEQKHTELIFLALDPHGPAALEVNGIDMG